MVLLTSDSVAGVTSSMGYAFPDAPLDELGDVSGDQKEDEHDDEIGDDLDEADPRRSRADRAGHRGMKSTIGARSMAKLLHQLPPVTLPLQPARLF